MTKRPSIVSDKNLEYLDTLRESGVTNMWGAGRYLEEEFEIEETDATTILGYWMETFSERHPQPIPRFPVVKGAYNAKETRRFRALEIRTRKPYQSL